MGSSLIDHARVERLLAAREITLGEAEPDGNCSQAAAMASVRDTFTMTSLQEQRERIVNNLLGNGLAIEDVSSPET